MESSPSRSDLARYLSRIREYPMLEADEEAELARAWRDRRDPQAAERLIGSHLRLVAKVARGYAGYGLPMSDMIAEGNMGMVQALNGFDPDRGYRFTTYALWWIRAAMQEYILRSWSMVRMGTTGAEKKLFFSLRRAKSNMNLLQEGDLSPEEARLLAEHLKVPVSDVAGMNGRLAGPDQSLNLPLPGMEDGAGPGLAGRSKRQPGRDAGPAPGTGAQEASTEEGDAAVAGARALDPRGAPSCRGTADA